MQAREGVSLDAQEKLARDRCAGLGWSLTAIYTDVMSGRKDDRPELARLLVDAHAGKIDAVFVYRLDRLGRSLVRTLQVVGDLADCGVRLISLTQPFEIDGSLGKLMLSIYASFAEMESEAIGARIRDNRRHRLVTEGKHYTVPPYGYTKQDKKLIVVPEQAEHVRWIFEQVAAGRGMRSIVLDLNQRGVPTKNGGAWSTTIVKNVVTCPTHCGKLSHGRKPVRRTSKGVISKPMQARGTYLLVEGEHEPIVSVELWEAAQVGIESRIGKSPKRSGAEDSHPWLSVVRCGKCGAAMCYEANGKPSGQLHCVTRRQKGAGVCDGKTISVRILNGALIRAMAPILKAGMVASAKRKRKKAPAQVDRAKELARLEAAITRESDLYRIGAQNLATTEARVKELRAKAAALSESGPRVAAEPPRIEDLEALWRGLPNAHRVALVRSLVELVTLNEDNIILTWRPELSPYLDENLTIERPKLKGTAANRFGID